MQPACKHPGCRCDMPSTLKAILRLRFRSRSLQAGYSLIELVLAVAVFGLVCGLMLNCYIQAGVNAEWSGYSLAAESLGMDQVEQARQAKWDSISGSGSCNYLLALNLLGKNLSTNLGAGTITLTGYTTNILDIPYATSTNYVIATNYVSTQIFNLNNNPNNAQICMLQVQTVWPFNYRSTNVTYFTNTIATYLAPCNESPTNLVSQ